MYDDPYSIESRKYAETAREAKRIFKTTNREEPLECKLEKKGYYCILGDPDSPDAFRFPETAAIKLAPGTTKRDFICVDPPCEKLDYMILPGVTCEHIAQPSGKKWNLYCNKF